MNSKFKDYSAMHAQSVCLLTSNYISNPNTCTISSFSPISSDIAQDFFSFSLSNSGFMSTTIDLGVLVRISLLRDTQSEVAKYFVAQRKENVIYNLNEIWQYLIGYINSEVISYSRIGTSILYIAKNLDIVINSKNEIPLIYRLRKYSLI